MSERAPVRAGEESLAGPCTAAPLTNNPTSASSEIMDWSNNPAFSTVRDWPSFSMNSDGVCSSKHYAGGVHCSLPANSRFFSGLKISVINENVSSAHRSHEYIFTLSYAVFCLKKKKGFDARKYE